MPTLMRTPIQSHHPSTVAMWTSRPRDLPTWPQGSTTTAHSECRLPHETTKGPPFDGGTNVQVFFLKGTPVFADAVEQWTKGNYSNCPFM